MKYTINFSGSEELEEEVIRRIADGKTLAVESVAKACIEWVKRRNDFWCDHEEGSVFADDFGNIIIRIPNNQILFVDEGGGCATIYHTDTNKIATPKDCTPLYKPLGEEL